MEEEWRMDMDGRGGVESRKKLDEQKRMLEKELREIEKISCLSKEFTKDTKHSG